MKDKVIGPELPPHLLSLQEAIQPAISALEHGTISLNDHSETSSDEDYGPALPPGFKTPQAESANITPLIGPVVPCIPKCGTVTDDKSSSDDEFGPALPPGYRLETSTKSITGPTLPPGFKLQDEDSSDEDDDFVIGPLPHKENESMGNYAQRQLEQRSQRMKDKLIAESNVSDKVAREEWMLELPPEKSRLLGLGAKSFSMKGVPVRGEDRSMWTDTPEDKEKKSRQPASTSKPVTDWKAQVASLRDKKIEEALEPLIKGRTESLLDMHRKKRKDKDMDGKNEERRPFDRDVDLQISRCDQKQKEAAIKKARLLDDRFSSGHTKFL